MTKQTPAAIRHHLLDQVDTVVGRVKRSARNAGDEAEDAVAKVASSAGKAGKTLSRKAGLETRKVARKVGSTVREHPLAAAAAFTAAVATVAAAIAVARHDSQQGD